MRRVVRHKLPLAAAVLAIVGGATAAVVMAAQPASPSKPASSSQPASPAHARGGPLASAAAYLGTSPAELRGELQSGRSLAQIANATPGKSAAGLIHELEASERARLEAAAAKLPARVQAQVDRVRGAGALASAARYLGLSRAQLRRRLQAGKTLAQLARSAAGKSEAGLVEALVSARMNALAAEMRAGKISKARVDELLGTLDRRVRNAISRAHRSHAALGASSSAR